MKLVLPVLEVFVLNRQDVGHKKCCLDVSKKIGLKPLGYLEIFNIAIICIILSWQKKQQTC